MTGAIQTLVAASFCWFLSSSLWLYPHSLSYFNESIGGPLNGPKHLLGSNVDWGQDLRYVGWFFDGVIPVHLHLAYAGSFDPRFTGFSDCIPVESIGDDRYAADGQTTLTSGWYAVSRNLIYGTGLKPYDGNAAIPWSLSSIVLGQLSTFKSSGVASAGYSIAIFRVLDEIKRPDQR